MARVGRGLVLNVVNGDIMQTRREQLRQLAHIDGELASSSAVRSTGYS